VRPSRLTACFCSCLAHLSPLSLSISSLPSRLPLCSSLPARPGSLTTSCPPSLIVWCPADAVSAKALLSPLSTGQGWAGACEWAQFGGPPRQVPAFPAATMMVGEGGQSPQTRTSITPDVWTHGTRTLKWRHTHTPTHIYHTTTQGHKTEGDRGIGEPRRWWRWAMEASPAPRRLMPALSLPHPLIPPPPYFGEPCLPFPSPSALACSLAVIRRASKWHPSPGIADCPGLGRFPA